eukprot:TRINITY_DN13507_c5_g2_i1.p1 TRINITY_DN13507_c5_g2~~TRINITY_DN13507_c5_g2_i1.p1  ORF type:complete len:1763 (+),score=241.88 TRINITY_DN13507_c5_g2_i1:72-5360(+)
MPTSMPAKSAAKSTGTGRQAVGGVKKKVGVGGEGAGNGAVTSRVKKHHPSVALRSTSAQRSVSGSGMGRSATTATQVMPGVRSLSPGGAKQNTYRPISTRGTARSSTGKRQVETIRTRRNSAGVVDSVPKANSRSVTVSPAARRLPDKAATTSVINVKRSASPATVYRRQSYHRAETNTSCPAPIPPLKMGRIERSLTMSSEGTPHAATARPFASPICDIRSPSKSKSPQSTKPASPPPKHTSLIFDPDPDTPPKPTPLPKELLQNANTEFCAELSSLVTLSEVPHAKPSPRQKEIRKVHLGWLVDPPDFTEALKLEISKSDKLVPRGDLLLCLTQTTRTIRNSLPRFKNTVGYNHEAFRVAVEGAKRVSDMAYKMCEKHLVDGSLAECLEGYKGLQGAAGRHGVTPSDIITEALLFSVSPWGSKADEAQLLARLQHLWDAGVPLTIGHVTTAGLWEDHGLLAVLDDTFSDVNPAKRVAVLSTSLAASTAKAAELVRSKNDGHFSPILESAENTVHLMNYNGYVVLVGVVGDRLLDVCSCAEFQVMPGDGPSSAVLQPGSGYLTELRAVTQNASLQLAKLLTMRRLSLALSQTIEEVVFAKFLNTVFPQIRADFITAYTAQQQGIDHRSKFIGLTSERVEPMPEFIVNTVKRLVPKVSEQQRADITNKVYELVSKIKSDCSDALTHDMYLCMRHHAVAAGPMTASSVMIVRSLLAGGNVEDPVMKAWDASALEQVEQVHAAMCSTDLFVEKTIKNAIREYLDTDSKFKPEGLTGSSGGYVLPELSQMTVASILPCVSCIGEVSESTIAAFLDSLKVEINNVVRCLTCFSTWDVVDPTRTVTEALCRVFHVVVGLEKTLLWPVGAKLRSSFYSGIVPVTQQSLIEAFKAGEDKKLQELISVEISNIRQLVQHAALRRTPLKIVSTYMSVVHMHALQCGLARVWQIQAGCGPGTEEHYKTLYEQLESIWKVEITRFREYVAKFPGGCMWDALLAYLCRFETQYFQTKTAFAVLAPFRKLGNLVAPDASLVEALKEDIALSASYTLRLPSSLISRLTKLPPVGRIRGLSIPPSPHTIRSTRMSLAHWGLHPSEVADPHHAKLVDCWTVLTSHIPEQEKAQTLLFTNPEGFQRAECQETPLEWPPRLLFTLTIPNLRPGSNALLRFDSHGSTCLITKRYQGVPIPTRNVLARETSLDGCVCIPLHGAGSYSALVCNNGGRSKLRIIDDSGSTLREGDVKMVTQPRHTEHVIQGNKVVLMEDTNEGDEEEKNWKGYLGLLEDPNWVNLPQVLVTVRGSQQASIVLKGEGAMIAIFTGTSRVEDVGETFIKAAKAERTPFGSYASTTLPEGNGDYIVVPYVPASEQCKLIVSHEDSVQVLLSTLSPPSPPPSIKSLETEWLADPTLETTPQYSLVTKTEVSCWVSVYSKGLDVTWSVHTITGEEVTSSSGEGLAAAQCILPVGSFILTVLLKEAPPGEVVNIKTVVSHNVEFHALGDSCHVFTGEWKGSSAGGGLAAPTFFCNPQFIVRTEEACDVSVLLDRPNGHPGLNTGVLATPRPSTVGAYRDLGLALREDPLVSGFSADRVLHSFALPAGTHTITPFLVQRAESPYQIYFKTHSGRLYVDPVQEWPYEDHTDGSWDAHHTTGGLQDVTSNPQYLITVKRGSRTAVGLAAFGLGDLALVTCQAEEPIASPASLPSNGVLEVRGSSTPHQAVINQVSLELMTAPTSVASLWVQFIVICATVKPGTEGSFRVSVYSNESCILRRVK